MHDYGIEQTVRDSRIAMIYEGTNEIQAIDLLLRKVLDDGGARLGALLDRLVLDADMAAPALAEFADALRAQVAAACAATAALVNGARHDAEWPLRAADDYLRGIGLTLLAWAWLKRAAAAWPKTGDAWHDDTLRAARFGVQWLLPEAGWRWQRVRRSRPSCRRCEHGRHRRTPMIDKIFPSAAAALADVADGATVMIGGFGTAGLPNELTDALLAQGARELTIVNNNAGNGDTGLAALLAAGRVRKIICSFPRQVDSHHFDRLYRAGKIELELVPQGNLAERIRAAGAGIGGFFTPTGYGTELAKGKETREIDGRMYVLESPIHADFALIKAERGDRWGNLTYRMTARNFGPVMAMAARTTVASVHEVVELGALDPECVVTPGLFVQRVVRIERAPTRGAAASEGAATWRTTSAGPASRWRSAWRATSPKARSSTWASACRRWWPTTCRPTARSCCTARTASSAWARRRPRAPRTTT